MKIPLLLSLFALTACVQADIHYCQRQGLQAGTAPFGDCLNYYAEQQALFDTDAALCVSHARNVYPDYLYDRGHRARTIVVDSHGYPRSVDLYVEPDYTRNSAVRGLRNQIVDPCMWEKGWNSSETWQAGRHPPEREDNGRKKHR